MSLFASVRRWFRGDAEALPSAAMPPRDALEQAFAEPARSKRLRTAGSFLADIDYEILVDAVRGFASAVMDLPASEKHHHRHPWGLLDHSLEVAEIALRAAQTEPFVDSTDAKPEEQEYRLPRLRLAAWYWGLLHDAGKAANVAIRGPRRELWNPFRETLLDFYERQGGGAACALAWRAGRGVDSHTWATAYLIGRLMPEGIAAHLGLPILREIIGQESPAAHRVFRLIEDADHRSVREELARDARSHEAARTGGGPILFAPSADYADRVPPILGRALRDGTLRATGDLLTADVFIGRAYVALRYPEALQKLAILIREELGRECAAARCLDGSEEGARALASYLHDRRRLFVDSKTDTWKLKAKIALGDAFDVLAVVLIPRSIIGSALDSVGSAAALFPGEIAFARASDGVAVPIDDFTRIDAAATAPRPAGSDVAAAPPPPQRIAAAETAPPKPVPTPAPAIAPAAAPLLATPRKFISGEILIEDLRREILGGRLATNVWNGQVYVLPDVTYLISPRVFHCLVELGLYARDPGSELSAFLDALARVPCVRKDAAGKVQLAIELRPGARPVWAAAFDTRGFFPDARSLAVVGQWTGSPIRELSETELRAVQLALRERKKNAVPAAPTDGKEAPRVS